LEPQNGISDPDFPAPGFSGPGVSASGASGFGVSLPVELNPSALTLVVYMLALAAIGFWASRKANTQAEFLLGGRALGPVVAGLAYAASTSSAWVLLGFTGFVAAAGVSALWMVPGILAGYAAVWLWLGPYLNRVSREEGHLTVLDVISAGATGPAGRSIKIVAALMILFCFSFYIAAQFQGAGEALGDVFGVSRAAAIVAGAAVILLYTFLGGFWAVSLTDTLQGLAIAAIALILPVAVWGAAGGLPGVAAGLAAAPEALTAPFGAHVGWSAAGFAVGVGAVGFGALGQPHLLTWVMAVRDRKARLQGAAVALGWGALVYAGMAVVALAARAAAPPGAALGEAIVFDAAQTVLPGVLPALVYAAILSAIMSTVDSQLLVASAAASHDLGLARAAPGREVTITRAVVACLCAGAVVLTLYLPATIFERVLFAWTALGAAFGPTLVARAAGRTPAPAAILAAMIAGFALAVVFNQILPAGPGAWKERILPWVVGLLIVFMCSGKRRAAGAQRATGKATRL